LTHLFLLTGSQIDGQFTEMTIPKLKEYLRELDPQFPIPSNIKSTPLKILATEKLREHERNLQASLVNTPGTPSFAH
jgi:hypothetical protein